MADFSRIRVTPVEEEDVVIVAGVVETPEPVAPVDAPVEEATFEEAAAPAGEPSSISYERGAVYEETTLDDLERTRMSGMQKAIIALAIVAVAVFIIWYVLLR